MDDRPRTGFFARIVILIRRIPLWMVFIIVILWSVGFYELGRSVVYWQNPGLAGAEQAAQILKRVGALIQLPQNETPSMATINDAAAAQKVQPFLANAQNGDILIVYPNAQTALLYRPSQNKLIAVGPVTSTTTAAQSAQKPIITTPPASSTSATSTNAANTY